MNENDPNNNPENGQPQNPQPQQPFDYQAHYRQQNRQYYNPQQPNGPQGNQNPQPPFQPPPVPPTPPVYTQYGLGDNTRVFSILSYISILWLVGLLADRNNPKVRFHVNQGIILTIFEVIVNVAISILHSIITAIFSGFFSGVFVVSPLAATLNGMLSLAGSCLFLAFTIIGVMHAVQDRQEPLPIIGTLFQVLK